MSTDAAIRFGASIRPVNLFELFIAMHTASTQPRRTAGPIPRKNSPRKTNTSETLTEAVDFGIRIG